jgi:hypothetical protein
MTCLLLKEVLLDQDHRRQDPGRRRARGGFIRSRQWGSSRFRHQLRSRHRRLVGDSRRHATDARGVCSNVDADAADDPDSVAYTRAVAIAAGSGKLSAIGKQQN